MGLEESGRGGGEGIEAVGERVGGGGGEELGKEGSGSIERRP